MLRIALVHLPAPKRHPGPHDQEEEPREAPRPSLHHGCLLGLQDVVRQDPGHGHLNGELDPPAHGQLQEELAEPQLRKVTALLQRLLKGLKGTVLTSCQRRRLSRRGRPDRVPPHLSAQSPAAGRGPSGERVPRGRLKPGTRPAPGCEQSHPGPRRFSLARTESASGPQGPGTDASAHGCALSTL